MYAGKIILASACTLSLAAGAGRAGATSIGQISPSGAHWMGEETLVMSGRPAAGAGCVSRAEESCTSHGSRRITQWAQISVVEVATEPSALQAALEQEWMRRLETVDARYLLPVSAPAISTTSR